MTRPTISFLRFGACLLLTLCGAAVFAQQGQLRPAQADQSRDPLVLTYVANEGVLLSSGDRKILIDALFDKPNAEYRAPSPDVLGRIMKGQAPYDGVDLLLVTHNHPDHFDAPLVARYLATVSGPVLVAPADAVAELKKTAEWGRIKARVVSLDIKVGEEEERQVKGIPVTALRTLHSGGDPESPMNLMYLLELDGWRIFHEGDSRGQGDKCVQFELDRAAIDLALVHFWFPLEPNCARFLQRLEPRHIALMHLPIRLETDAPGKIEQVRHYYGDLFLMLPGMPDKIFKKGLEGKSSSSSGFSPTVDGHNHQGFSMRDGGLDTSKLGDLKSRGIHAVLIPLPVDRSATPNLEARLREEITLLRREGRQGRGFSVAADGRSLLKAVPEGDLLVFFSIEWNRGPIFGGDPSRARRYRELGVRLIGLSGNDGDGLFVKDSRPAALSTLGKEIIAAMNDAGLLIDITHLTHEQKLAVITGSRAPVVASHSLVQSVTPVPFNLPEEVVTALADHGGSVWASFNRSDLLGEAADDEAVGLVADHIAMLVKRLGADRVGIGTDLQADGKYVPVSLNQPDSFVRIRHRLEELGFSPRDIEGLFGGNILCVLSE